MGERFYPQSKSIVKQNQALHTFAEGLVKFYVQDFSFEGAQYAREAERRLRNGEPIETWFAPHESHADYTLIHKGLSVAVSAEFAHDTYAVMGSMLKKLRITRFLMHAYNGVLVPSIRDVPKDGDDFGWDMREGMKHRAFAVIDEIHANDKSLALNAEGTRVGGTGLKRGFPGVGRYPRMMGGGYILPAVTFGGEDILKIGSKLPRRRRGGVRFGKLIPVEQLLERAKNLPLRDGDQLMVDIVMSELARLLPKDKRGEYAGSI